MERMAHFRRCPPEQLYNYSQIFPFEATFTPVPSTVWMQDYWYHSLTLSVLYAAAIYVLKKYMSKRAPFDLERALTIWNAALAVFSIAGSIRMTPEFVFTISKFGFQHSICTAGYAQLVVTGFWTNLFALSKSFELVDTLFIILRKKPLMFLHWYHHITVLIYTWHAYKEHTAAGRWFIWMNYHVHAFMYSYYALRAMGFRFPKWTAMSVTTMQIVQMVVGCAIGIRAYTIKREGGFCQVTYENLYFSFAIYFTYFLLFANFFYHVYLKKGNRYQKGRRSPTKAGAAGEKEYQQNGHAAVGGKFENGHAAAAAATNAHASNGEAKKVQ